METAPELSRLFSGEIFGRLPSTGRSRVRRTALSLIGVFFGMSAAKIEQYSCPSRNVLLVVLDACAQGCIESICARSAVDRVDVRGVSAD